MLEFVEFLISNPFILFIVIALIGGLLRKREKPTPARPVRRNPAMPNFGNEERQFMDDFPQTVAVARETRSDEGETTSEWKVAAEKPYRQMGEAVQVSVPISKPVRSQTEATAHYSKAKELEQAPQGSRLSAEEARLGMMWAEVFGPPRAKRPYRR